jgi:hypothetical protein
MLYDLKNPLQKQSFKAKSELLFQKGDCVVELKTKRGRTINQNSYLHLILSYFGAQTGNTLEYVKEYSYKRLVNPDIFIYEKEDKHIGKVEVLRSSKDLSVDEMRQSVDKFKHWALIEGDVFLPDAASKEEILQMEIEVARNRMYL